MMWIGREYVLALCCHSDRGKQLGNCLILLQCLELAGALADFVHSSSHDFVISCLNIDTKPGAGLYLEPAELNRRIPHSLRL